MKQQNIKLWHISTLGPPLTNECIPREVHKCPFNLRYPLKAIHYLKNLLEAAINIAAVHVAILVLSAPITSIQ